MMIDPGALQDSKCGHGAGGTKGLMFVVVGLPPSCLQAVLVGILPEICLLVAAAAWKPGPVVGSSCPRLLAISNCETAGGRKRRGSGASNSGRQHRAPRFYSRVSSLVVAVKNLRWPGSPIGSLVDGLRTAS